MAACLLLQLLQLLLMVMVRCCMSTGFQCHQTSIDCRNSFLREAGICAVPLAPLQYIANIVGCDVAVLPDDTFVPFDYVRERDRAKSVLPVRIQLTALQPPQLQASIASIAGYWVSRKLQCNAD